MKIETQFGKFLNQNRQNRNPKMSIRKLSKKVFGNYHNTGRISSIEKGDVIPDLATMEKLLNGLELSLKDVFVTR